MLRNIGLEAFESQGSFLRFSRDMLISTASVVSVVLSLESDNTVNLKATRTDYDTDEATTMEWYALAEKSLDFWDNEIDAIYDDL
jgi:hypothetical protein